MPVLKKEVTSPIQNPALINKTNICPFLRPYGNLRDSQEEFLELRKLQQRDRVTPWGL